MVSEVLRKLMDEHGMTTDDVAREANLPVETVRNLKYEGRVKEPKVSTLKAIGNVFHVSINYLLGEPFMAPDEVELIENYRGCSVHGKNRIDMIARYEAATGDEWDEHGRRKIPCSVPPQIDVRKGIMYDSCDTVYIWTSFDEAELAIEMVGNELSPLYCKGDKLLFANRFPANGEHAAFIMEQKVYIRKFIEENGQYRLKCLHNEGKDIVVKRMDQIEYLGTCIGVVRE
jgi:transcriptional regulator with XRE-family HTH domain